MAQGEVVGTVMRSPTCPVERIDTPCPPQPASGRKVLVSTPAGEEITSVVTDAAGRYRARLAQGTYRIELAPLAGSAFSEDVPATVTVTDGEQRKVDIAIDTGIRSPGAEPTREAQPPGGMGALVGTVTKGPTCPVERLDDPCDPAPVPDATIKISGPDGAEVTSVVTDEAGHYSAFLPPGSYRVDMAPLEGLGLTKDLPTTVTIGEEQTTGLDIRIDTGIR